MIELHIQKYVDRQQMVLSLVNSGYTVKVIEKDNPKKYLDKLYFVQIVDEKEVDVHNGIIKLFKEHVIRANHSNTKSEDRVYYNGLWRGFKEAAFLIAPNLILDENNLE